MLNYNIGTVVVAYTLSAKFPSLSMFVSGDITLNNLRNCNLKTRKRQCGTLSFYFAVIYPS